MPEELRECVNCHRQFPLRTFSKYFSRVSQSCDRCKHERMSPKPCFTCFYCNRFLQVGEFGYDENNRRNRMCAKCRVRAKGRTISKSVTAPSILTRGNSAGQRVSGSSLVRSSTRPLGGNVGDQRSLNAADRIRSMMTTSAGTGSTIPAKRSAGGALDSSKAAKKRTRDMESRDTPKPKEEEMDASVRALNTEQRQAYDSILKTINDPHKPENALFMLKGRAGTGKTHLLRTLYTQLTKKGKKVVCIGATEVAASLLDKGNSVMKLFQFPAYFNQSTLPALAPGSESRKKMEGADLIVWDEMTKTTLAQSSHVENSLQIMNDTFHRFGGIPVVFAGDFAQWLPDVKKRSDRIKYSIRMSSLWDEMRIYELHDNMRVNCALPEEKQFAEYLEKVAKTAGTVPLPPGVTVARSQTELEGFVFPDSMTADLSKHRSLTSRAIIVDDLVGLGLINRNLTTRFPGRAKLYYALDESDGFFDSDAFSWYKYRQEGTPYDEFLESRLELKVGMPVILLQSVDEDAGLHRGTRAVVENMDANDSVKVRICGGPADGTVHTIGSMRLHSQEDNITRSQIPLRPCFAITVKESQGQSLDVVGVHSTSGEHGAFYVAVSRATSCRRLAVLSVPGTVNALHNSLNPVAVSEL